jgi:hypothetical protein
VNRYAKRVFLIGTSPWFSMFWVVFGVGFIIFDWAVLTGGWRWFIVVMPVTTGANLWLAGMRVFSPRWRETRRWLEEQ